jgi:hypothetical protein
MERCHVIIRAFGARDAINLWSGELLMEDSKEMPKKTRLLSIVKRIVKEHIESPYWEEDYLDNDE